MTAPTERSARHRLTCLFNLDHRRASCRATRWLSFSRRAGEIHNRINFNHKLKNREICTR
jgi:hypothetical protein